jgi:hypothetical protein
MGATQSTTGDNKELKAANILDILATKYILTQNFQDMKRLGNKDYCNKLIIITADIIKKFLKEKEITYLTKRVEDGVPVSKKEKDSVIYLSTNKLKKASETTTNNDGSLLSQLDVKNQQDKDSMCKGIAKFYIKIAHLFAAILKAVNPIYKYDGHEMSIMNKSNIPAGANVKLSEINLCNRRIKTLKVLETEKDKISVQVKNCDLNKKITQKHLHKDILDNLDIDYGTEIIKDKQLGNEIGIPELEKLYYDIFNYETGRFTSMSSKARESYEKDLKTFYKTFTGKNDYSTWNSNGDKKFQDIPLIAYHDTEACKNVDSAWQKTYEGSKDNPLFKKFAKNVQDMLNNTKKNQQTLLEILDKLFVWIKTPSELNSDNNSLDSQMVTINPKLNSKTLQDLVVETRKLIIKIYLQCEEEYQQGLKLFEAIVSERILKNSIDKKNQLEKQLDTMVVGKEDANLQEIIKQNIDNAMQPKQNAAAAAGGSRKKKYKRSKSRK